MNIDLVRTF